MADSNGPSTRHLKQERLINSVVTGKRALQNTRDVNLFLQAICSQPDHAACIEKLACSKSGLDVFRRGLRFDTSINFINGPFQEFLTYIKAQEVKRTCNGDLLKRVLAVVVSPPTLWAAMTDAHQAQRLSAAAEANFAWILLELLTWTGEPPVDVTEIAREVTEKKEFLSSEVRELRSVGCRIEHILQTRTTRRGNAISGPGGRHDNDFVDFRQVGIYPTEDEITSKDRPFYNPAHTLTQVPVEERVAHHLENQFRLLREDFLAELREDLKATTGNGNRRQRMRKLSDLDLAGVHLGGPKSRVPFSLVITAQQGLEPLTEASKKVEFLRQNPNFLKHQSLGYFIDQDKLIAFGTIARVESLLLYERPGVVVRTHSASALKRVLLSLSSSRTLEFILIDTAVFAYEPVLQCLQSKFELPLWKPLLCPKESAGSLDLASELSALHHVADEIENSGRSLQEVLELSKPVHLDDSQTASLLSGLRNSVSLIQGPPGTGKSFIGALCAKCIHDRSEQQLLVVCYTNHALDQFLEDLMDIGIPDSSMVRLGAKSTLRTKHLNLREQAPHHLRSQASWSLINQLNAEVDDHAKSLERHLRSLRSIGTSPSQLLEYLEFADDATEFFDAFRIPEPEDDFATVGEGGHSVNNTYLLRRWIEGRDAGIFQESVSVRHSDAWTMDIHQRREKLRQWEHGMAVEEADSIVAGARHFDDGQQTLFEALSQHESKVIQKKRIIACTTTAAAKYSKLLQSAAPGIVLVEEAGEILESHILTAMSAETKQLIQIGDHQQLRPKVNNYNLTVEKGDGYDLNCSLFERLIKANYPHSTLSTQHRMCPEISNLVRHLTYPNLVDAPSTTTREPLRGLLHRVVFVAHEKPELSSLFADKRDHGASKQNKYEVQMVKKIVKYMAQQGYGTSSQAVLTSYLGQLQLLRQELAKDNNDPVLNDIDSFDLIKAGIMPAASAKQMKRPLKLSTIDNYQGDEADIVIVSLTRSNPDGDIGFMRSPERLNVLLSRARKALIIIGNPATFKASRKGGELWSSLLTLLAESGSLHDGLPVRCTRHPDREMLLASPEEFDQKCPDGGCSAPCGQMLKCGVHECPRKCHRLDDHSKTPCSERIHKKCPQGHKLIWKCSDGHPSSCHFCDAEAAAKLVRKARDAELDRKRQERQSIYACELVGIKEEIDRIRQQETDRREAEEQGREIAKRRKELENAQARREAAERAEQGKESQEKEAQKSPQPEVQSAPASEAALDWQHQKEIEGAQNSSLDDLMGMIGLEAVKEQFLEIKAKVDLLVRQDLSLENERFGAALLGNPGTGKTTVARLYASFLCSVGALPGDVFVESTGAKLASEGVQGCKKLLDGLLNQGGGAFFIDEAYQLASGSNPGGGAVLDFLLPEIENLKGKVVFILAGYDKQMENNPGLPSRFPARLQFVDYEDEELLAIFNYNLNKRYEGRMRIEDGPGGLFARIVARRIGRGRGKEGFGNARAVENAVAVVALRQAKRLRKARRRAASGKEAMPDDMFFSQEDLIGPEPSSKLGNKSWLKLEKMTGLRAVKDSVKALLDTIQHNYERELAEEPLVEYSLNKVFVGSPGTGKTSCAKLYGQILADIGMLSSGEVVIKHPADFIANVIGGSEANTKAILDAAVGKVLVIDEAYGLYGGSNGDPFRTAVIDTIVAEVQSTAGDDRCVLLLGYRESMEEMMQHVNPGLARRFPIDSGFTFDDFTDEEMAVIFDAKLENIGFKATDRAREVALGMLQRARNRPHFGNAGEVDIVLDRAKLIQQKRTARDGAAAKSMFEAQDFDADFDRIDRATTNVAMLFKDTVGCESIVSQLQDYQQVVANMKKLDADPREQIPFTFLFRGPPGTGKTTTAQKMGKVYYDMGFLSKAEVVPCSASQLVGEYVGQTGPKTRKLIESAMGKVLFIDEAYRLSGGLFAKEALDELVDCLTSERFFRKLIVILAGYDADINALMSSNPGLSSRFPDTVVFHPLPPQACLDLLIKLLEKKKGLDLADISAMSAEIGKQILHRFATLSGLANFANARDVQALAKSIFASVIKRAHSSATLLVSHDHVLDAMDDMIAERTQREFDAARAGASRGFPPPEPRIAPPNTQAPPPPPETNTASNTASTDPTEEALDEAAEQQTIPPPETDPDPNIPGGPPGSNPTALRDAGVSDAVWDQLQRDRLKAEHEEREFRRLQEQARDLEEWLRLCADAKRQKELEELRRKRKEAEERRRKEQLAQEKLKSIGRCPVGYAWIKQSGGYRCEGGSHWIDDKEVERLVGS